MNQLLQMYQKLKISPKQQQMLDVLEDNIHTEVFGGGSAGGSKSFTGCLWQLWRRIEYPGTRGFIARARLKNIKQSTLLTFFEVAKMMGLKFGEHFTYNAMEGVIKFKNGSEEYLKDLFLYPSDPDFVNLGSTEFTDGFIDEMGEITEQAYNIMKSRIRFKLDEFNLIPKIFMGSNPCKTFVYREFYRKWKDRRLEPYKAYVPASVYDNPFISEHYISNLKRLDPINRARLLEGNWEYDADDNSLVNYDAIIDMFSNEYVFKPEEKMYITCDPAGMGKDRAVIYLWQGWYLKNCWVYAKSDTKFLRLKLDKIGLQYKVPRSKQAADTVGLGHGLGVEHVGLKAFVAGASPILSMGEKFEKDRQEYEYNFANLKAQCAWEVAKKINAREIGIYPDMPSEIKNSLIEELEQLKRKDIDKDEKKIQLISKEDMKSNLRRSPDLLDCLIIRGMFELLDKSEAVTMMLDY